MQSGNFRRKASNQGNQNTGLFGEEIIKLYPHLTMEDIKECIRYAAKLCRVGETEESYGPAGNA